MSAWYVSMERRGFSPCGSLRGSCRPATPLVLAGKEEAAIVLVVYDDGGRDYLVPSRNVDSVTEE